MRHVTTRTRLALLLAAAGLPAAASAQSPQTPSSSGQLMLRDAGKAYAEGDLSSASGHVADVLRRAGKTVWEREALYLRALFREKENGDLQGALHDLRLLTTRHPGTAAAVYGQFNIARVYEKMGMTAEAYREYVLCSRLRGLRTATSAARREDIGFPALRLTTAGARGLIDLASVRAVRLLPEAERKLDVARLLPTHTYLLAEPPEPLELPDDARRRRAPSDEETVWYLAAPAGAAIGRISVAFSAYVDAHAGGPPREKRFSLKLEPCSVAHVAARPPALVLTGVWLKPRKMIRQIAFDPPLLAAKVSLYRNGARVTECTLRPTFVDRALAPPPRLALPGIKTIVPPERGGAGGLSVASFRPFSVLAYHAPALAEQAGLLHDRDMFLTHTSDGRAWAAPSRIRVSSACDDAYPSIAALGDGRLLLAWTSNRRGEGSSDLYVSVTRDLAAWSAPVRLAFESQDLESFGPRAFVTYHCPVVHVDARRRVRVFFVAKGFKTRAGDRKPLDTVEFAGLFGVISADAKKWSKPACIISSPHTPLDRFGSPPKESVGKELVSWDVRPSVLELGPGQLLVAWATTYGRLFFSRRNERGRWTSEDTRVAGSDLSTAATGVALLEAQGARSFKMLITRRDLGAQYVWNADGLVKARKVIRGLDALPFELGGPVAVRNLHTDGWLTVWRATRASCHTGAYVVDVALDEE